MAGVITNVINTVFTSKGAKKVERETEAIGRAQTRLGQSSASAGRTFAAQSQGLGGLVAAYAGAAATIFAVSAAFDALSKAAAAENIVKGTNVLAASVGQVGPQLIASIKEITDNQVTLAEAAQNANIALSTGFSSKQILGLTDVANKAARTLGRDLTDAFQRLVRGTSKLEPELLDELGIFVRLDPAVKAYAEQLGKAANELNEFERRQAFANAAIEEGSRKFGIIDTSAKSTQKSLEQLRVKVSELFTEFLQVVSKALIPLVDFLNNNLGAALAAFGLLAKSVFSKAAQEAAIAAASMGASFGRFADKSLDFLFPINTADFEKRALQLNKTLEDSKNKAAFRTKPYSGQSAAQFEAFNKAITAQRTGAANTLSTLRQVTIEYEKQLAVIRAANKNRKGTTLQERILQRQINENNKTLKEASSVGVGARNAVTAIGATVTSVASFVGRLASRIFFITTAVQFFLSIFGIDVFSAIAKFFSKIGEEAEKATRGIVSLTAAISGGAEITNSIKLFDPKATADDINDVLVGVDKEINRRVNSFARLAESAPLVGPGMGSPDMQRQVKTREEVIAQLIKEAEYRVQNRDATVDQVIAAQKELVVLRAYEKQLKTIGDVSRNVQITITELTDTIGIAGAEIVDSILSADNSLGSIGTESITVLGLTIKKYSELNEEQRRYATAGVSALNTIRLVNESFSAGTLTSEQLGKQIAGISEQYITLKNNAGPAQKALEALGVRPADAAEVIRNAIRDLADEADRLRGIEKFLSTIETNIESIKDVFSSELKITQSGLWDGIVNASGRVAKSEEEIKNNQIAQLLTTLQTSKVEEDILNSIKAKQKEKKTLTDEEAKKLKLAEQYNIALEASKGLIIASALELEKINKKQREQLSALQATIKIREIELDLQKRKNDFALEELALAQDTAARERALELEKAKVSTYETGLDLLKSSAEIITTMDSKTYNSLDVFTKGLVDARKKELIEIANSLASDQALGKGINQAAKDLQAALVSGVNKQKALIQLETALTERKQKKILENFDQETRILLQKIAADQIANTNAQQVLEKEQQLADVRNLLEQNRVKFETSLLRSQVELLTQRAQIVAQEAESVNTFGAHVNNLAIIINNMGTNLQGFIAAQKEGKDFSPTAATLNPVGLVNVAAPGQSSPIDQVLALSRQSLASIEEVEAARLSALALEKATVDDNIAFKLKQLQMEYSALQALMQDTMSLRAEERKALQLELTNDIIDLENELIDLGVAAGNASDKTNDLKTMLTNIFSGIESAVQGAFTGIKDFLIFGEGDLRTVFSDLFKNIGNTIFEEAVNKPLSNMLTQTIFKGIYGDKAMGMIADGTIYNPYYVKFADNDVAGLLGLPKSGDKNDPATKIKEVTGGFFDNIKEGFSGAFGFIKNILSGFGSFAGNIFKGIFSFIGSIFGLAAGGAVHRAGGGAIPQFAAGGGLRDRVPTLLEPGEFVLRRMAAGAIGMPALQQMNATGQMPGNGSAPVINFKNEGTPKDVEASQPRFDGEKYVIDIITRDLQNNGPIRKTLRGGL